MSRVRLQNVTKRYASTIAVDGVSLDVAEGEFVTVKQSGLADAGKIRIDSTEWPALRAAIDRMILECRPLEITATTPS